MVMNDLPARVCLSEQQSKSPVRLVFTPLQVPTTQNYCRVFAQDGDLDIGKCQHAHFVARVVSFFVTFKHSLPATRNSIAGNKDCVGGARVPVHVGFEIAAIPRRRLGVEYRTNRGDRFSVSTSLGERYCRCRKDYQKSNCRQQMVFHGSQKAPYEPDVFESLLVNLERL